MHFYIVKILCVFKTSKYIRIFTDLRCKIILYKIRGDLLTHDVGHFHSGRVFFFFFF